MKILQAHSGAGFARALFRQDWLVCAGFACILAACAVRPGGDKMAAVDTGLITGSIARPAAEIDPKAAGDGPLILAKLSALGAGAAAETLAWQNDAGGASGVLSAFSSAREDNGALCRVFQTTRESYDGAALYRGEACKYGESPWSLRYLRAQ